MTPLELRALISDTGGPELAERLEALDTTIQERLRGPQPISLPASHQDTRQTDFDVALVGGGLSLLMAPLLASRGIKVAVFDKGTIGKVHREWNASEPELQALIHNGLLTQAELERFVIARYDHGICKWFGGGTYPVWGVLDHAVDAQGLLSHVRHLAQTRGVTCFDHHTVQAMAPGDHSVVLQVNNAAGDPLQVAAKLVIDARGVSSEWCDVDLICPTVGGVVSGLTEGDGPNEVNPKVGDILVTTEDVQDGHQHIWEGFPGHLGELTTYLFYYAPKASTPPFALMQLYARFFATLPQYKKGQATLIRPTFGYIPGWSRLTRGPRSPHGRILLFGDSAARHSPLTFCGFGHMLRAIEPFLLQVAALLAGDNAHRLSADLPIHRGTGALAAMMANPNLRRPRDLNALLDTAFGSLHAMGNEKYAALLKDQMSMADFRAFLWRTSRQRLTVYREALASLGAARTLRWGASVFGTRSQGP